MRNQPLKNRTIRAGMCQPETWSGYKDARSGLPFCKDYDSWEIRIQRNYERGRAIFFNITLANVPLPRNPIEYQKRRKEAECLVGKAMPKER